MNTQKLCYLHIRSRQIGCANNSIGSDTLIAFWRKVVCLNALLALSQPFFFWNRWNAVIIGCSTGICSVQFALSSYAGVRNGMGNYMKVKLLECMNDSRSTPLNSRKFCKTFCLVEKSFAFFSLKILFQKNYLGFKLLFTQGNFQEAVVECSVKTVSQLTQINLSAFRFPFIINHSKIHYFNFLTSSRCQLTQRIYLNNKSAGQLAGGLVK